MALCGRVSEVDAGLSERIQRFLQYSYHTRGATGGAEPQILKLLSVQLQNELQYARYKCLLSQTLKKLLTLKVLFITIFVIFVTFSFFFFISFYIFKSVKDALRCVSRHCLVRVGFLKRLIEQEDLSTQHEQMPLGPLFRMSSDKLT